jgi:hypothetical protein
MYCTLKSWFSSGLPLVWPLQVEEAHKPSYHVKVAVHEEGATPSLIGEASGALWSPSPQYFPISPSEPGTLYTQICGDSLKACDNGWFIIGTLFWTLSIVWCILEVHEVSEVRYTPVFRWLVVIIKTISTLAEIQRSGSDPEYIYYKASTLTTRQPEWQRNVCTFTLLPIQ